MRKIPTLFERDGFNRALITATPAPGTEWVFAGEGVCTRKLDGTACCIHKGAFYKRREVKDGATIPPGFWAIDRDDATGKTFGWVPVDPLSPEDRWHREALQSFTLGVGEPPDGSYELVGPKVQGNPEGFLMHKLVPHGLACGEYRLTEIDYETIRSALRTLNWEGFVWHHPDGLRKAKIKRKDFGFKRGG